MQRSWLLALMILTSCVHEQVDEPNVALNIDPSIIKDLVNGRKKCESAIVNFPVQKWIGETLDANKAAFQAAVDNRTDFVSPFAVTLESTTFRFLDRLEITAPTWSSYIELARISPVLLEGTFSHSMEMTTGKASLTWIYLVIPAGTGEDSETRVGPEEVDIKIFEKYECITPDVTFLHRPGFYQLKSKTGNIQLEVEARSAGETDVIYCRDCRKNSDKFNYTSGSNWAHYQAQLGELGISGPDGGFRVPFVPKQVFDAYTILSVRAKQLRNE